MTNQIFSLLVGLLMIAQTAYGNKIVVHVIKDQQVIQTQELTSVETLLSLDPGTYQIAAEVYDEQGAKVADSQSCGPLESKVVGSQTLKIEIQACRMGEGLSDVTITPEFED